MSTPTEEDRVALSRQRQHRFREPVEVVVLHETPRQGAKGLLEPADIPFVQRVIDPSAQSIIAGHDIEKLFVEDGPTQPLADHGAVLRWASNPTVALALILMLVSVFWHLRLGLQVMIEDYVHGEATRLLALVVLNFYAIGGAAYGIFAIVRIALAPAALGPGGM